MSAQTQHESQSITVPPVSEWTPEQWQDAVADVHAEANALLPTFMPVVNESTNPDLKAQEAHEAQKSEIPLEARLLIDQARNNPAVARSRRRISDRNITPDYIENRKIVLGE